jgi:uncharacterized protein (TIGR00106 family)
MSVIVDFSIFPTDKGESVSQYVARAVKIVQASGLPYELNPMGTCIEGDWPYILKVVDHCFQELQKDSRRIYLTVKADYRKGTSDRLKRKVASVQEKLDRSE